MLSKWGKERVIFYPDSHLFISRNYESKQIKGTNQYIEKYTFLINVWDKKPKISKLIKTVNKTYKTTYDW